MHTYTYKVPEKVVLGKPVTSDTADKNVKRLQLSWMVSMIYLSVIVFNLK